MAWPGPGPTFPYLRACVFLSGTEEIGLQFFPAYLKLYLPSEDPLKQ